MNSFSAAIEPCPEIPIEMSEKQEKSQLDKPTKASRFAQMDEATLSWFHLRAVVVSGVGFFADAYDIFVINLALPMFYRVYYPKAGTLTDNTINKTMTDVYLKAATSLGNLIGQLGFGFLGDILGRKKMYGWELVIMIVSTIGSITAGNWANPIVVLGVWRLLLGIGIGGDYPMSAIITSEFANTKNRGMMMAAVFALQGVGILTGSLLAVILLSAMKGAIAADEHNLDIIWRVLLGAGIIPAIGAIYFRMTIPETPRFTAHVIGDVEQADADVQKVVGNGQDIKASADTLTVTDIQSRYNPTFFEFFGQWKNLKVLFATAYCWFALDIAFYGLSLNASLILKNIGYGGSGGPASFFLTSAIGQLIIAFMGTVPGYWITVFTIDKWGRKPIQFLGFAVITICLTIMAITWTSLKANNALFIFVFTVANLFFNFGPNATTFVIPGEVFPTRFRSTGHGISAATGKAGAILGTFTVSLYFTGNEQLILGILAAVMATGFAATFLLPEPMGKSLEEINDEAMTL